MASLGPLALAVLIVGIAYGAQSHAADLPLWLVLSLAVLVLGASSELLFVGMLGTGAAPMVAAVAALLVNLRHIVYGIAVSRFLPHGPSRLLAAHFISDETVAVATGRAAGLEQTRAFWLLGMLFLIGWPAGALVGFALGDAMTPEALGMDAVFPAVILAILLPQLRDGDTLVVGALAVGVAVATVGVVPAGIPPVLALLALAGPALTRRFRR